jgi:hypothetical protein
MASGAPAVSLKGMANEKLRLNIERLQELFPYQSTLEIRNALAMCNSSFDDALDLLSGSPGSSSIQSSSFGSSAANKTLIMASQNPTGLKVKSEYDTLEDIPNLKTRQKIANLLDLDISQPISFLLDVLGGCNWNVNEAANRLLNDYVLLDGSITQDHEPLGEMQGTAKKGSVASTAKTFDPTPPPTPPSPNVQAQQYPDGVILGFRISLRHETSPTKASSPTSAESQGSQLSSSEQEGSDEQNPEAKPTSIEAFDIEMGEVRDKQNPELSASSEDNLDHNTETNGQDETVDSKVAQLRELLPRASRRRCQIILQIYPDLDEAFEVLDEELAEHGSDESSDETEEEDSEASGDESEAAVQGKNSGESGNCSESRGREKRKAEVSVSSWTLFQNIESKLTKPVGR